MSGGILGIIGGLGLFLMGMAVMTEGLKDLAGDALRRWLTTFTRNPLTGAVTGMVCTAILQSSSATTVMAVGFVAAGLLTFPQALGIIFGANIGTTLKGWLVAWVGFKLDLGEFVLPLIFIGSLMRLFGQRRFSASGYAIAGFGLIFVGISMLQHGMLGFQDVVTPENFPPNTILGRLLLVLMGIAITLVTQSSSAGVAAAITAVHVGNISLAQAGALVIGMDVGTTFTAAMSAIGGNVNTKRTGLAHVIYNGMTGIAAFFLLPLYLWICEKTVPNAVSNDPEMILVGFHSMFNFLGVVAVLPFTNQFARLVVRIIPPHERELTRRLDVVLLSEPDVAIESVYATLVDVARVVFASLTSLLRRSEMHRMATEQLAYDRIEEAEQAVAETRRYLSQNRFGNMNEETAHRFTVALHVLDHLHRLIKRCKKRKRIRQVREDDEFSETCEGLTAALSCEFSQPEQMAKIHEKLKLIWIQLGRRMEPFRHEIIARTALGDSTTDEAIHRLDAIRWLRRICYHAYRITHHLLPVDSTPEATTRVNSDLGPDEMD
ncbi:MAG: Na/Pi symporter [Planctomycetota bacterium]|nr:Na/Pi symporter [Planctomycetota bacterium]MDA1213503.1 Na/Pi symporter [Planctomycetota bacterium]